mgnify:CR=1 FL=1
MLELKNTAETLPHYTDPKNLALFEKHNVYTPNELHARENILLTNYYQVIEIEAKTMSYMLKKTDPTSLIFEYMSPSWQQLFKPRSLVELLLQWKKIIV